jgi:hypothetical protein
MAQMMVEVQVRCPNSGLWASTGEPVGSGQWQPADFAGREVVCGICGDRHVCSMRGVRVPPWA